MRANRWIRATVCLEAGSALPKLHYPSQCPTSPTSSVLDQCNMAQPLQNGSGKDGGRAPLSSWRDETCGTRSPYASCLHQVIVVWGRHPLQPQAPRVAPRRGGIPPEKEQRRCSGCSAGGDRFAWKYQHLPHHPGPQAELSLRHARLKPEISQVF